MNIETRKVSIISWIANLNDEKVLIVFEIY